MKTLYFECNSGISGDMTVAALLDLGADQNVLEAALASLPVKGFSTEITRVKKAGLDACDFAVKLDAVHENHDHDMEYLHGHEHSHSHFHGEEEPDHAKAHHEHSHPHEHRGLPEILDIIRQADMTASAKALAEKIFTILGRAEAKAHGVPLSEVHFHEVGAVDSIVDIVAVAVCLDMLGVEAVILPRLCEGQGTIRCQHGILPVPVPAVTNIAEEHQLPLAITQTRGELVTPTGAAIAAAICTSHHLPETFVVRKTGLGAGKRNYDCPGFLRVMEIEAVKTQKDDCEETGDDRIWKLETNLDDCTGELLGYVMEQLFRAGARDVHYTPVYMKKNRPAYQLNVICDKEQISAMEQIIFRETTSIGIRRMELERTVLKRSGAEVDTPYGHVKVKECILPDGTVRCYPEYESAAELAAENHVPLQEIYTALGKQTK